MKLIFIYIICLISMPLFSQSFGINTTDPAGRFHIKESDEMTPSTLDGILLPRINSFPVTSPTADQDGMMVYLVPYDKIYYWDQSTTSWKWLVHKTAYRFNDLLDAKSDRDGTNNDSSIYLGEFSGVNDDLTDNRNVGVGYGVLQYNTSGEFNVGVGYTCLANNTLGSYNTAIGSFALKGAQTLNNSNNTAVGDYALFTVTNGNNNTAIGSSSLYNNKSGDNNVAVGRWALQGNTSGNNNTSLGFSSLESNGTESDNCAMGVFALTNSTASENTAIGNTSMYQNTTGEFNTAFGGQALYRNSTGNLNTALGYSSGNENGGTPPSPTNSTSTTFIGSFTGSSIIVTNSTVIGSNGSVTGDNMIRVAGSIFDTGGFANWTNISDGRFKKNIKENVFGLSFIKKLRPVTYFLDEKAILTSLNNGDKDDFSQPIYNELQSGFIAQEVEEAVKSIGFDFHGVDTPNNEIDYYGLRYADFVVPLVKAVQEQQDMINEIDDDLAYITKKGKQLELLKKQIDKLEKKQ